MKKLIAILFLIAILCTSAYLGNSILKNFERKKQVETDTKSLPIINFENLEGSKFYTQDLDLNKPSLILYFNPDCEHCQYEARAIRDSLPRFAEVNVLLISDEPIARLQAFAKEYDLAAQPNIHILYDGERNFKALFGTSLVPSIFIYNRQQQLVKQFKGETKMEAILKYLE